MGMSREKAIDLLDNLIGMVEDNHNSDYDTALKMGIKALEQEPILDKIRVEIERLQKMCDKNDLNLLAQYSAFGMVLDILDKYKAESEDK